MCACGQPRRPGGHNCRECNASAARAYRRRRAIRKEAQERDALRDFARRVGGNEHGNHDQI